MASSAPSDSDAGKPAAPVEHEEIVFPTPSLFKRMNYAVAISIIKVLDRLVSSIGKLCRKIPASENPTFVKAYPVRPHLKHHFFIPQHDAVSEERFPLYIDIHGGGFANGWPYVDDKFCSNVANDHRMVVVSLNYGKAPKHRFPGAVHDLIAIVKAVLADDLPIDRSRIVIGGFSAGGALSLAVAQDPELRPLISAVMPWYPVVNFAEQMEEKLARRPEDQAGNTDHLVIIGHITDYSYVPQGQNRRDPALSPFFADPATSPEHVYFIGAEKDILCSEARLHAEKLAEYHSRGASPREALPGVESGYGWQQGPVCWEMAKDWKHGFADTLIWWNKEQEAKRSDYCRGIFARIHTWLEDSVWKDRL